MGTTATTTVLAVEGDDDRLHPLTAAVARHQGRLLTGSGGRPAGGPFPRRSMPSPARSRHNRPLPVASASASRWGRRPTRATAVAGPPVDDAVALAQAATAGDILTRPLVQALVASRRGVEFNAAIDAVGDEPALSIGWQRGSDPAVTVGFPHGLSVAEDAFIGRQSSWRVSKPRCSGPPATGCQAVFIAGEPGVGKTRLASTVRPPGARCTAPSCSTAAVTRTWAWRTSRSWRSPGQIVDACTPEAFATLAGPRAGELRRLLAAGPAGRLAAAAHQGRARYRALLALRSRSRAARRPDQAHSRRCWWSTICTGRPNRRCGCCDTSSARRCR